MKIFLNQLLTIGNSIWQGTLQDIIEVYEDMTSIIAELKFHPDVEIYYSSNELNTMVDNLTLLNTNDDYMLTNNIIATALLLFDIGAIDTIEMSSNVGQIRFFYWNLDAIEITEITGSLICSMAICKLNNEDNIWLLSLKHSDYNERNIIPIIYERVGFQPEIINLPFIGSTQLRQTITDNRIQRLYIHKWKHGENGQGGDANASKLLCSILEAEVYLKDALGYTGKDELFYFDEANDSFMIYRMGAPTGIAPNYHAYHLERNIEHNDIPVDIRRKYRSS